MKKHIQKVGAAVVLLLFLLSIVPVALADTGLNVGVGAKAKVDTKLLDVSTESKVEGNVKSDLRFKKISFQGETDSRKEVLEKREDLRDKAERKLLEAKVNLRASREDYLKIKERYRESVQEHKEQREKVRDLDNEARRCRDDESEECREKKIELKLGVIIHLEKTIDVVDRALEKLKNKVEDISDLSEDEKDNAFRLIAALEERLDSLRERVDNFDENTTREEVSSAISELKEIAQEARELQKRIVSLMINAKLRTLVEKHGEFRNGMELRIETLVEMGADVSELQKILDEFDLRMKKLMEDYQEAQQKWEDSNNERFDQFAEDVRREQNQVRRDLQETKKILRDFIKVFRELKNELDESEDDFDEKEETEVEVSGDVELSSEARATLGSLVESMSSVEGKVELKLKIKKEDDETKVESEVEGSLTAEQEGLWNRLQEQTRVLVEEAEGDVELEIEIEHEKETDEDKEETDDSNDEETDESEDNETDDSEEETEDEDSSEESSVKISGDVELSAEAQATLDSLAASLSSDAELTLVAEKKDSQTTVETEVESSLTLEQEALWTTLQNLVESLLEEAEGNAKLEISIEGAEE